jgi:NitT/TauT family transport system substrate-binding protein
MNSGQTLEKSGRGDFLSGMSWDLCGGFLGQDTSAAEMLKRSGNLAVGVKLALVLAMIFGSSSATTAPAAERMLRVSYSAPAAAFLPLWAAKEAGIFEKNHVSVELLYVGSSPLALAALLSDELDVLAGGGTAAPTAYLQGFRDLALFSTLDHRFAFKIFSVPAIVDVAGLRGKRFGVTRFGGSLDFASRYFLKSSGLDPQRDLQLVQIGNTADILAALVNGNVDAGSLTFPYNFSARKLGFRQLADLSQSGARYATAAFLSKRSLLTAQQPRMQSFVRALVEAIHYVKTNPEPAVKILQRYTRIADREILKLAYDEYAQNVWPRLPAIEPEDIKLIVEHLAQTNPKAREIQPAALIYSRLVDDVARSGLVEQLYGK